MNEHIKKAFEDTLGIDSFRRVDDTHVLDLYLGMDQMSRCALLLVSDGEPLQIYSSQIISIQVGQRTDGKLAISFSLINDQYKDLFCHFCGDIINSSRLLRDKQQGIVFVCNRYMKWQQMLRKNALGLMSFSEVKGLIGELYFLKAHLFPKYGITVALKSWIGPQKADQDFVCAEGWFEVKATVSGSESVRISSIEQLDTKDPGELVLVYLDKTSYSDPKKITLNALIKEIEAEFSEEAQYELFRDILLNQGYFQRQEYDEYLFRFSLLERYSVDESFPSLRRRSVPNAVVNAGYTLSIADINRYLKEHENGVISIQRQCSGSDSI